MPMVTRGAGAGTTAAGTGEEATTWLSAVPEHAATRLIAIAEAYPALKVDAHFLSL